MVRGHLGIIRELTGAQVSELTFSGGAAKGALWPQIIADVLGLPVHVPAVTESSALGAALCAGTGAGLYAGLTDLEGELRKRAATFEPQPAAVTAYTERYERWRTSTRGCSPCPRTGCSTRCGGPRAPGRLSRMAEGGAVAGIDSLTAGDRFDPAKPHAACEQYLTARPGQGQQEEER